MIRLDNIQLGRLRNIPKGSGQALITQGVAAVWILPWFAVSHWHLRSVAPQVVEEEIASARHWVAQAGIAADA